MLQKFGFEIQSQSEVKSPECKKSNMATRLPFWKWHIWKSIGFFPYTLVLCYWSLDLIFKAKQKLESGNRKIQDGRQTAILKVTSLKINRLLLMATNNMRMKLEIEIPKQTWVTLRKPCRLQTDGQTDKVIPVYSILRWAGGGGWGWYKYTESSTYWQFFYYRPPSKFRYTAGEIAKNYMLRTRYIQIQTVW